MLNQRIKTQMRWLHYYEQVPNSGSKWGAATVTKEMKKLQYRQRVQRRPKNPDNYRDSYYVEVWSDWEDVPIVWKDEL
jgi:hypothetical protein